MKFLFPFIYLIIVTFFTQQAFSQSMSACSTSVVSNATCKSSGVLIYAPGSSSPVFAPPSAKLSLGQLQITYSATLDASNVSGFNYDATKWGVIFGNPPSTINFYYPNSSSLPSGVTAKVDATKVSTSGAISAGTVVVTIDFTHANPNNTLTNDIINFITSGSLQIQPLYAGSTNITSPNLAFNWKVDTGAMLYGPSISVQAQDSAFVANLSPPSSLNAATPTPTTGTATSLTATTNSLSGYVIVYWLDTDAKGNSTGCKANPGGFQFLMNPIAFATAPTTPTTCTYTQYQTSFNTGGNSSAFGCPSSAISGNLPFDSTISASALTADTAAIPYTPGYSNPSQIPSDSNGTPSGCYNVVYVPASQSSWSKGNINDGDIYGVVAWALNSAATPNYSLAHSNISYITGVNIPLASLDKNPNLAKSTTDCFVVTSASGNSNSSAVFYWRVLRDEYLTPMGITPFYYQHAKAWAHWLDTHPKLKPAFHTFFEYSGKYIYRASGYLKKTKEYLSTFMKNIKEIWIQEAGAQELPEQSKTEEKPSVVKEQEHPFKQPRYDIFITGGVFFPTADKMYYDKFYSTQPNAHIEGGANYIFWLDNLGFSSGLLGRYLTNTSNGTVTVLGTQQPYTINFYSLTAEAIVGLRYRNPCWSYLQPGIFAGGGITRFREESSTTNSTSTNVGVTKYSPTFEFGGNLDINLIPIFSIHPGQLGKLLSDISLRLSASYNINPTPALSSTGVFVQGGFVFLLK